MLQDSLKASGTLFGDLNKFEQKAFASALGTDVDTLRRSMQELDPFQELQVMRQEQLARKAGEARDILAKLKDAFNSLVIANQPFVNSIIRLIDKFSVFIQKNHDLTAIFDKHVKPKLLGLQRFIMKNLIPTVKFLTDNWRWLLAAWGAVKLSMGVSWLMGFVGAMGTATAATAAQGAAASTAATANAANARAMSMGRFGMAGLGLAAGAATMAGTNYFRNKNMRGAAGATGVLGGAASGAMMGSFFGPAGTAVGAVAGGIAGGIYANRDYNDAVPVPGGGFAGLDSADKGYSAPDGTFLGFGTPGGTVARAAEAMKPNGGGSSQQVVTMIQGLPAAIVAGIAGANIQASLKDSIAVNPHGLLSVVNDPAGPVAQAASPFLGGSY